MILRVFPMYCNGYSYRHGFHLYAHRWAIAVKPSWSGGVFGNGSRWTSGWFDWVEEDRRLYGTDNALTVALNGEDRGL